MKKIKKLKLFGLFQLTMLVAVYAYPVQQATKNPVPLPNIPQALNNTSNTVGRLGIYQYWKSTIVFRPAAQADHVRIGKSYTNAWMGKNLPSPLLSLAPSFYHINLTHAAQ
jgi:hypothetical protein